MPQPVNEIKLSGRLTKEPEIKEFVNGKGKKITIARFTLAFGFWHGKRIEPAWYFPCVVFGPLVKLASQLTKGEHIVITRGYLQHNTYTAKDGNVRRENIIIVEDYMNVKGKSNTAETMEREIEQAEDIPF